MTWTKLKSKDTRFNQQIQWSRSYNKARNSNNNQQRPWPAMTTPDWSHKPSWSLFYPKPARILCQKPINHLNLNGPNRHGTNRNLLLRNLEVTVYNFRTQSHHIQCQENINAIISSQSAKSVNGFDIAATDTFFHTSSSSHRGHTLKLYKCSFRTNVGNYSFSNRIIGIIYHST